MQFVALALVYARDAENLTMRRAPKLIGERMLAPAERRARQTAQPFLAELVELQADDQAWLDALPENRASSALAAALGATCEIGLSQLESTN